MEGGVLIFVDTQIVLYWFETKTRFKMLWDLRLKLNVKLLPPLFTEVSSFDGQKTLKMLDLRQISTAP